LLSGQVTIKLRDIFETSYVPLRETATYVPATGDSFPVAVVLGLADGNLWTGQNFSWRGIGMAKWNGFKFEAELNRSLLIWYISLHSITLQTSQLQTYCLGTRMGMIPLPSILPSTTPQTIPPSTTMSSPSSIQLSWRCYVSDGLLTRCRQGSQNVPFRCVWAFWGDCSAVHGHDCQPIQGLQGQLAKVFDIHCRKQSDVVFALFFYE
jgi:hypothetical protein